MNALTKVKLVSGRYELIVNTLPQEDLIDGTTALLTTDGTSYEVVDGDWKQTDEEIDKIIQFSLYPFLLSLCNSISNDFVKCNYSQIHKDVTLAKNIDNADYIDINNIAEVIKVQTGDFIRLRTIDNDYLTKVIDVDKATGRVTIDGSGLEIRITGEPQIIGLFFVSFPPSFIDTAYSMLAYDLFDRQDKEKRQERLGNYTYTNFEPVNYYGSGNYPAYLEDSIKYYQIVRC